VIAFGGSEMEGERFDAVSRACDRGTSRRGVTAALPY
jgi:hypothetical protein